MIPQSGVPQVSNLNQYYNNPQIQNRNASNSQNLMIMNNSVGTQPRLMTNFPPSGHLGSSIPAQPIISTSSAATVSRSQLNSSVQGGFSPAHAGAISNSLGNGAVMPSTGALNIDGTEYRIFLQTPSGQMIETSLPSELNESSDRVQKEIPVGLRVANDSIKVSILFRRMRAV